jgi:hypothetical protein
MRYVILLKCVVCSVLVSIVIALANGQFATDEAQRLYDLLDGLGCFESETCELSDFTPTIACDYNFEHLQCGASGLKLL